METFGSLVSEGRRNEDGVFETANGNAVTVLPYGWWRKGLLRAMWTDEIQEEWLRNLLATGSCKPSARSARHSDR